MMKYYPVIFIVTIFFSCSEKDTENNSKSVSAGNETIIQADNSFSLLKIKEHPVNYKNICDSGPIEFIDLYPRVRSILVDTSEKLKIVQELKKEGFKIINWGRGNFSNGPKIISFEMAHDKCTLRVDKLYYSTDTVGVFRITERIIRQ